MRIDPRVCAICYLSLGTIVYNGYLCVVRVCDSVLCPPRNFVWGRGDRCPPKSGNHIHLWVGGNITKPGHMLCVFENIRYVNTQISRALRARVCTHLIYTHIHHSKTVYSPCMRFMQNRPKNRFWGGPPYPQDLGLGGANAPTLPTHIKHYVIWE